MPRKKKPETAEAIKLGDLCTAAAFAVIREEPDEDSGKVCCVQAGTALLVTEAGSGWFRVLFGNVSGWVPDHLLRR